MASSLQAYVTRIGNNEPELRYLKLFWKASGAGTSAVEALAAALRRNTRLRSLNVSTTALEDENAIILFDVLKVNRALATLNVTRCGIGARAVRVLANTLEVNKSLRTIILEGNKFGTEGAQYLAAMLEREDCAVTTLNVASNKIQQGATAIARSLETNTSLTSLDLSETKLGQAGAEAIANALCKNSTLTHLSLTGTSIGARGAERVVEALKTNMSLKSLDLTRTKMGPKGAVSLAEAVRVNTSLTSLDLEGKNIGREGAITLCSAFSANHALRTLNLKYAQIGDDGANALAKSLRTNTTINTLNLAWNDIKSSGIEAISTVLLDHPSLTTLGLEGNDLGFDGATAIANVLKASTCPLLNLNVGWTTITAPGVEVILKSLCSNERLKSIDFAWTECREPDSSNAIADMLIKNTALNHLGLEGDELRARDAETIADALRANTSLTSLNMLDNKVEDVGARALLECLRQNVFVKVLKLSGSGVSDDILKTISKRLNNNTTIRERPHTVKEIDLSELSMTALPEWLFNLRKLKKLDLRGNKLEELDSRIAAFTDLQQLKLTATYLRPDLQAAYRNGLAHLQEFLRESEDSKEPAPTHIRVFLMGHAGAGKSKINAILNPSAPTSKPSMKHRLRRKCCGWKKPTNPDGEQIELDPAKRTPGFCVSTFTTKLPEHDEVTFSIWDSAGFAEYDLSNELFWESGRCTPYTIFAIVTDASRTEPAEWLYLDDEYEDQYLHDVVYWLRYLDTKRKLRDAPKQSPKGTTVGNIFSQESTTTPDQASTRVIVIGTHTDVVEGRSDGGYVGGSLINSFLESLRTEFNEVRIPEFLLLDAKAGKPYSVVDRLKECVMEEAIRLISEVDAFVPSAYNRIFSVLPQVREEMEQTQRVRSGKKRKLVPFRDYAESMRRAMEEVGYKVDANLEVFEIGLRHATVYLHDMGEVVYFDVKAQGLRDWVILDPGWLTEGVLGCLLAPGGEVKPTRRVFHRKANEDAPEFIRINDVMIDNIESDEKKVVFGLLEQFELCFPFESHHEQHDSSSHIPHVDSVSTQMHSMTVRGMGSMRRQVRTLRTDVYLFPCFLSTEIPSEQWREQPGKNYAYVGRRLGAPHTMVWPRGFFHRLQWRLRPGHNKAFGAPTLYDGAVHFVYTDPHSGQDLFEGLVLQGKWGDSVDVVMRVKLDLADVVLSGRQHTVITKQLHSRQRQAMFDAVALVESEIAAIRNDHYPNLPLVHSVLCPSCLARAGKNEGNAISNALCNSGATTFRDLRMFQHIGKMTISCRQCKSTVLVINALEGDWESLSGEDLTNSTPRVFAAIDQNHHVIERLQNRFSYFMRAQYTMWQQWDAEKAAWTVRWEKRIKAIKRFLNDIIVGDVGHGVGVGLGLVSTSGAPVANHAANEAMNKLEIMLVDLLGGVVGAADPESQVQHTYMTQLAELEACVVSMTQVVGGDDVDTPFTYKVLEMVKALRQDWALFQVAQMCHASLWKFVESRARYLEEKAVMDGKPMGLTSSGLERHNLLVLGLRHIRDAHDWVYRLGVMRKTNEDPTKKDLVIDQELNDIHLLASDALARGRDSLKEAGFDFGNQEYLFTGEEAISRLETKLQRMQSDVDILVGGATVNDLVVYVDVLEADEPSSDQDEIDEYIKGDGGTLIHEAIDAADDSNEEVEYGDAWRAAVTLYRAVKMGAASRADEQDEEGLAMYRTRSLANPRGIKVRLRQDRAKLLNLTLVQSEDAPMKVKLCTRLCMVEINSVDKKGEIVSTGKDLVWHILEQASMEYPGESGTARYEHHILAAWDPSTLNNEEETHPMNAVRCAKGDRVSVVLEMTLRVEGSLIAKVDRLESDTGSDSDGMSRTGSIDESSKSAKLPHRSHSSYPAPDELTVNNPSAIPVSPSANNLLMIPPTGDGKPKMRKRSASQDLGTHAQPPIGKDMMRDTVSIKQGMSFKVYPREQRSKARWRGEETGRHQSLFVDQLPQWAKRNASVTTIFVVKDL